MLKEGIKCGIKQQVCFIKGAWPFITQIHALLSTYADNLGA
jgi:hypothetical protein